MKATLESIRHAYIGQGYVATYALSPAPADGRKMLRWAPRQRSLELEAALMIERCAWEFRDGRWVSHSVAPRPTYAELAAVSAALTS
jgi:hypothetical protein